MKCEKCWIEYPANMGHQCPLCAERAARQQAEAKAKHWEEMTVAVQKGGGELFSALHREKNRAEQAEATVATMRLVLTGMDVLLSVLAPAFKKPVMDEAWAEVKRALSAPPTAMETYIAALERYYATHYAPDEDVRVKVAGEIERARKAVGR